MHNELIKWLQQEEEEATAEFEKYRAEYLAGGDWKASRVQRDYWHGYAEATTNALAKLTGMGGN